MTVKPINHSNQAAIIEALNRANETKTTPPPPADPTIEAPPSVKNPFATDGFEQGQSRQVQPIGQAVTDPFSANQDLGVEGVTELTDPSPTPATPATPPSVGPSGPYEQTTPAPSVGPSGPYEQTTPAPSVGPSGPYEQTTPAPSVGPSGPYEQATPIATPSPTQPPTPTPISPPK
jgi:hypothetical protein